MVPFRLWRSEVCLIRLPRGAGWSLCLWSRRAGPATRWRGSSTCVAALRVQARPLMPLERPKPLVWGADKEAKRPAGCTPDDRGRLAPFPLAGRAGGWVVGAASAFLPLDGHRPAWGAVCPFCHAAAPLAYASKTVSAFVESSRKRRRRVLSDSPCLTLQTCRKTPLWPSCAPWWPWRFGARRAAVAAPW